MRGFVDKDEVIADLGVDVRNFLSCSVFLVDEVLFNYFGSVAVEVDV